MSWGWRDILRDSWKKSSQPIQKEVFLRGGCMAEMAGFIRLPVKNLVVNITQVTRLSLHGALGI